MALPRGPIYTPDDSTPDKPDNYEAALVHWRDSARQEAIATAKLSEELGNVQSYIDILMGRHWKANRPRYKSSFVSNRVAKTRFDKLSLLTSTKPTIDVSANMEELNGAADTIENVIKCEWFNNEVDLSLITAADIAYAYGTAFWKMGAGSPGMMNIIPCGPGSVMPIQPGFNIQQSTAVLYETWKSLHRIQAQFGRERTKGLDREVGGLEGSGSNVNYDRPNQIPEHVWNGLNPGMQRALGIPKKVVAASPFGGGFFGSLPWQEFYVDDLSINESRGKIRMKDPFLSEKEHNWWYDVEPGQRLYPRKRLICFAGSRVMYDGPSPYWHGLYPFATLRFNPVFWSFWGLSRYRDLLPLNKAMNEIVAGILDMIKKILNPVAVTKDGAVPPSVWKEFWPDEPGAKLKLGPMGRPSEDVKWMDKPEIPSYVFQVLTGYLIPEFEKMSDLLDVTELAGKKQIPGGDTIEQMRDTMQTGVKLEERLLESFITSAGKMAVSNVVQFYTAPTRMKMLGGDGLTLQDFVYNPGTLALDPDHPNKFEHWKQFPFRVMPGSLHGGAQDRGMQLAMALRRQGDISRKEVWRRTNINNPTQIENELYDEAMKMAQVQAASQPPDPKALQSMAEGHAQGIVNGLSNMAQQNGSASQPPAPDIRMTRGQRNGNAV